MKLFKLNDMKSGWFIGDFEPTAYSTKDFEVSYRVHPKGQKWDTHYHKKATEINLLVSGQMILHDKILIGGDIFILEPFETAAPVFLEDCTILCVKTPSEIGDKYVVVPG